MFSIPVAFGNSTMLNEIVANTFNVPLNQCNLKVTQVFDCQRRCSYASYSYLHASGADFLLGDICVREVQSQPTNDFLSHSLIHLSQDNLSKEQQSQLMSFAISLQMFPLVTLLTCYMKNQNALTDENFTKFSKRAQNIGNEMMADFFSGELYSLQLENQIRLQIQAIEGIDLDDSNSTNLRFIDGNPESNNVRHNGNLNHAAGSLKQSPLLGSESQSNLVSVSKFLNNNKKTEIAVSGDEVSIVIE